VSSSIIGIATLRGLERWLAKFGHWHKSNPCLKAAKMPPIRSTNGKTSKGDKTLVDLTQHYDVHPNEITAWKAQLSEGAAGERLCDRAGESGSPDAAHGDRGAVSSPQHIQTCSRAQIYPYLLRGLKVDRQNQVWATYITYIAMARGFVYLVAVVDWFTRRVLSWRLSITMEVAFCLEAVEEALAKYGKPDIFNSDQGSQFTSAAFTGLLLDSQLLISMDGRVAWRDNVFVERLWRSVKYEEVYLRAYDSVAQARASLGRYLTFYNTARPHSSLDARTPNDAYFNHLPLMAAA
jgi:transposase InsO family protein